MMQKPLYRLRTPGREIELEQLMDAWWKQEEFRELVRANFAKCESPYPYVMFEAIPNTDIWLSYILDEGHRTIYMLKIGKVNE